MSTSFPQLAGSGGAGETLIIGPGEDIEWSANVGDGNADGASYAHKTSSGLVVLAGEGYYEKADVGGSLNAEVELFVLPVGWRPLDPGAVGRLAYVGSGTVGTGTVPCNVFVYTDGRVTFHPYDPPVEAVGNTSMYADFPGVAFPAA